MIQLPSGIFTCKINNYEATIIDSSDKHISVRIAEPVTIDNITIAFFDSDKYDYTELILLSNNINLIKKFSNEFYYTYNISIKDIEYTKLYDKLLKQYQDYIWFKLYEAEPGYESDKEILKTNSYKETLQHWVKNIDLKNTATYMRNFEVALKIDNHKLYKRFIEQDFNAFKKQYFKQAYIGQAIADELNITRVYLGNEFCHNLFPSKKLLFQLLDKAAEEKLEITICFTYVRDYLVDYYTELTAATYNWCKQQDKKIEVVINDWGMLGMFNNKADYISISLGVLLNKRKKDSRISYKKDINNPLLQLNSLNTDFYSTYLVDNNISRIEYDVPEYKLQPSLDITGSIQIPFYITNLSQYCGIYNMCTTGNRGTQQLATSCPHYCENKVLSYEASPMIGIYNALFGFNRSILTDIDILQFYNENNIDRIVFNFML